MISQFRGPFLLQGQKFVYIEIFPSVWTQRYFDIVRTSTQLVRVHFSKKKEILWLIHVPRLKYSLFVLLLADIGGYYTCP